MAERAIERDAHADRTDNGIIQPDSGNNKPSKRGGTTAKPRTKPAKPRTPETKPAETPYILNEVQSDVVRDNVDIRLKAAQVESLPDQNVMVSGAVAMLLLLLDGVGMMAFGDYARLNGTEKAMLEEPLTRMLAKVSPNSLNLIGKYSDPVLLMMGLLAWISRVTTERKRREEAQKPAVQNEPQPQPLNPAPPHAVDTMSMNPPPEIVSHVGTTEMIL